MSVWNERYAGEDYHFGTEPNAFLVSQQARLTPGMSCLAVADGEGRNGVWLAQQGLHVLSVNSSPVALQKAQRLAAQRGMTLRFELADLMQWDWGTDRFDAVAAVFIQFVPPALREQMFAHIKRCLKPGGLLIRRASWNTAPAGRRRPRTFTPRRCCAKRSPTWKFCICPNTTPSSAKARDTAACRH